MRIPQMLRPTTSDRALAKTITALPATRGVGPVALRVDSAETADLGLQDQTTPSVAQGRAAWRWELERAA